MNCLIELHSHLDGTIAAETLIELARGGREHLLPTTDLQELSTILATPGFSGFLRYFQTTRPFRASLEDIRYFTRAEMTRAHTLGVIYAEYRFNSGGPAKRGTDPMEIIKVITDEMRGAEVETGLKTGLIFGIGRSQDSSEIDWLLSKAREAWQEGYICGVDLNGDEAAFPTDMFIKPFSGMAQTGCPVTIHAGEWAGPESVWAALRCGASRIAHGVRAIEDDELVRILARDGIILEICPSSNVSTEVYARIQDVPVRKLFDKGIAVTINTDDSAAFGTNIADEWARAKRVYGFTAGEVTRMLENGIAGSFLPASEKETIQRRLSGAL